MLGECNRQRSLYESWQRCPSHWIWLFWADLEGCSKARKPFLASGAPFAPFRQDLMSRTFGRIAESNIELNESIKIKAEPTKAKRDNEINPVEEDEASQME